MTNYWPVTLPSWTLAEGFREVLGDTAEYFKPDTGPVRVRRTSTVAEDIIMCSFILSRAQYKELMYFYKKTLYGGSETFQTSHPVTNDTITVRLRKPPEFMPIGGGFEIKANLTFNVIP